MSSMMEEGRMTEGPDWMRIVENVKQTITQLQVNLETLNSAQKKQLKGGDKFFEDVDGEAQAEVDALNKKIGKLFGNANQMVKRLTATGVGSAEDVRVRKNIQMALASDLQDLSTKFRKKHKDFLKSIKEKKAFEDDTWKDFTPPPQDEDDVEADMGWSQSQLEEISTMDHIIDERDKEITKIAQSVSELAQLFRELSVLVIDSGTILDRIDYNMEEVVVNFEQAEEELEKTEKIMKQGKSAYCILFLMLACIIMAIILIIKKTT